MYQPKKEVIKVLMVSDEKAVAITVLCAVGMWWRWTRERERAIAAFWYLYFRVGKQFTSQGE
jgi:hypothetical protein